MVGPTVYVSLDIIDLQEVAKVLPRPGARMVVVGENGEMPYPVEGDPLVTLFEDIEAFRQTRWFKGTVVGYKVGTESYNPTDKCLVQLDNGQLIKVDSSNLFEYIEFDQPQDGNATDERNEDGSDDGE